jgi:hypothetical protein
MVSSHTLREIFSWWQRRTIFTVSNYQQALTLVVNSDVHRPKNTRLLVARERKNSADKSSLLLPSSEVTGMKYQSGAPLFNKFISN